MGKDQVAIELFMFSSVGGLRLLMCFCLSMVCCVCPPPSSYWRWGCSPAPSLKRSGFAHLHPLKGDMDTHLHKGDRDAHLHPLKGDRDAHLHKGDRDAHLHPPKGHGTSTLLLEMGMLTSTFSK